MFGRAFAHDSTSPIKMKSKTKTKKAENVKFVEL
jgi:hypothetical protein